MLQYHLTAQARHRAHHHPFADELDTPNVSSPESSFKETHRSMDSDGSDDSFSPLRGVRASSPLRGARAPSPLARQWILGAVPIGHP